MVPGAKETTMYSNRGASKPAVVALLVAACLSALACEEPQRIAAPTAEPPTAMGEVIASLSHAYLTRDIGLFASLLANDPGTNAEFVFLFDQRTPHGETHWDRNVELRLQQRMFAPEAIPPGDSPLPAELWLSSLAIDFTRLGAFRERHDLYSEDGGLDGRLDATRWRAMSARYATYLLLDCGENDYLVDTESNFVVIEDLTKGDDESGKFLIYSWEELCSGPAKGQTDAIIPLCLSRVKDSYR